MTFSWNSQNTELLRRLIEDEKRTYRDVARIIGAPRNACIGRYGRQFGRCKPKAPCRRRERQHREDPTPAPASLVARPGDHNFVGPFYLPLIHELGERQCKWPVAGGDNSPHRFCGALRPYGEPYCSEHATRGISKFVPDIRLATVERSFSMVKRTASGAWMS